jgi:hypothetical protein
MLASLDSLGYALPKDGSLVRCAHTTIRPSSAFGFGFRLQLSFSASSLSSSATCFIPRNYTIWLALEWYGGLRPLASFAPPSVFSSHMSLSPRLHQPQRMTPPNLTDDRQPLVSVLGHHHACLTCIKRLWVHGHGSQSQNVDRR